MHSDSYDKAVDVTAYAITVSELFLGALVFTTDDPDSDIDEAFGSGRIADIVTQRIRRSRTYIPSALVAIIYKTLRDENRSIEPFVNFFESSLKHLAFGMDTPREHMSLLARSMATPGRLSVADKSGE